MKAHVDTHMPPTATVEAQLSAGIDPSATSMTVRDGSMFPTSNFKVRIDLELISIASRSGNILTVAQRGRGAAVDYGWSTTAAAHPAGASVWQHSDGTDFVALTPAAALLVQLGVTGYEIKARSLLSTLFVYASTEDSYGSLNYIRWYWPGVALGYDWIYHILTPREKSVYAASMRRTISFHLSDTHAKEFYAVDVVRRPSAIQTALFANIASGQLRSELMLAAASFGENPDALVQWQAAKAKVDKWLVPALQNGPASGGNSPEGSEYSAESWSQVLDMFDVIESATGTTGYDAIVDTVAPRFANYLFLATLPGATTSIQMTSGTIAAGSRTMTVSSRADFDVLQGVRFILDNGAAFETYILAIDGNTFVLRDAAPGGASGKSVGHTARQIAWGDALENNAGANMYADSIIWEGHIEAAAHAMDGLRKSNHTWAGYLKYWLDNIAGASTTGAAKRTKFMWYDPTVDAVDYRVLPTIWGSTQRDSTGMFIGQSTWSESPTRVVFLVGGEMFDHTHSHFNSYTIWRKGVYLSNELCGYGVNPYPGAFGKLIGEGKHVGARYHNTVLMNGHGGNNGYILPTEQTTPATIERAEIAETYFYGRGDASGQYTGDWTAVGYESNNARKFVRDFLYLKPDLVVFADRLEYSQPAPSQTKWIARFTGDPQIAGQTMTAVYSGQKIVQDIVVPSAASLTKIDEVAREYPDLTKNPTPASYRVETLSTANASSEWSLQVIQTMDEGSEARKVTGLTTSRANIAQVGTEYVIGAVKESTPALEVKYSYVGSPTHYLMGFAPSTPYHIAFADGGVSIGAATGAGDVKSTSGGLLIFSSSERRVDERRAPPPSPTLLRIVR